MTLATRLSRASLRNISFARARFQSTTSAPPVAEAANAAAGKSRYCPQGHYEMLTLLFSAPTTPKQKIQSSVPEGTPLKGLNYLKGAPEVKALADEAYPGQ